MDSDVAARFVDIITACDRVTYDAVRPTTHLAVATDVCDHTWITTREATRDTLSAAISAVTRATIIVLVVAITPFSAFAQLPPQKTDPPPIELRACETVADGLKRAWNATVAELYKAQDNQLALSEAITKAQQEINRLKTAAVPPHAAAPAPPDTTAQ